MLVLHVALLLSALSSTLADDTNKTPLTKPKRGIAEATYNISPDNKYYQPKLSYQPTNQESYKLLPKYKNVESSSYQPGYKDNHGSTKPSFHYGPLETAAYTGYRAPTYPTQILGSSKYSIPTEGNLFTMPQDVKAVSESVHPSEHTSNSGLLSGPQKASSYTPSFESFNRNKFGGPRASEALGYSSYSGIDETQPEETHRNLASLTLQAPVYKSSYPRAGYSPSIQTSARAPAKLIQSGAYHQVAKGLGNINGKKIPVLQVESGEQLGGYSRGFESQPLVLSTGLDYPGSRSHTGAVQASAPFLTPVSGFQAQVVPIQTSSSTPQFPQYRGARVESYPLITNPLKTPTTYQALQAQPHLHFNAGRITPLTESNNKQSGLGSYGTSDRIRSDVEIINKEKPTPLPPSKDDDDSSEKGVDHGYDVINKQHAGQTSQEDEHPYRGKQYSSTESDFKPSKSFPFRQYDDTFGKYSSSSSEESEKPNAKYTSYSSSGEEEDDRSSPSAKYSSSEGSSYRSPYSRYEEEDQSGEEEVEKDRNQSSGEQRSKYSFGPKSYKYQSKDFGQDFEDSYRKGPKYSKND